LGVKRDGSHQHVSVLVAFDQFSDVFKFTGKQTGGDDSWAAWLVIQIAS
jgi:hypothetical protein